jgi:putative RecB family exonuclease
MNSMLQVAPTSRSSAFGPARDYISFSALRTYQACPLKYFFKYVAGLPDESATATLLFGSAIHRAIEAHFREIQSGRPPPSLATLLGEYEQSWQERQDAPVQFGKDENAPTFRQQAERVLAKFASSELARPAGRIVAIEQPLRGCLVPDVPDLLGYVDLIVETAQEWILIDWKTSRARWTEEQFHSSIEQLLLYSALVPDRTPRKNICLQLSVITKTKEPTIESYVRPVDIHRLTRTKHVVQRVWRSIEAEHFYPSPSPQNCSSCGFRRACAAWSG